MGQTELLGSRVGRIRIVDVAGKGGMGSVFVGFDEKLERRVAVKAIRESERLDADVRARFLREARILSQLDHRGICKIYDYVESGGKDYLVLELVSGKSLAEAIPGLRSDDVRAEIAAQIADRAFDDLDAPIRRLNGLHTPTPYSPTLEAAVVPKLEDLLKGVRKLLEE